VTLTPGEKARIAETLRPSRPARLATLVVSAKDPADTVEIVGIGSSRNSIERRVEPGTYELRVHSRSGSSLSRVTVAPGTEYHMALESPRASWTSSPWFWIAAGAAVAGATTAAFILLNNREADPARDSEFGVVVAGAHARF
jgi:hypothetical protein